MTVTPVPAPDFQPWRPIARLSTVVQYALGACCAATYALYAIARWTVGAHDHVVSGNVDPKDLGSGVVTALARVLHLPAALGAIVGPWAGVPFALVTLVAIAVGARRPTDRRWVLVGLAALLVTAVVAAVGQLAHADAIRHWILD